MPFCRSCAVTKGCGTKGNSRARPFGPLLTPGARGTPPESWAIAGTLRAITARMGSNACLIISTSLRGVRLIAIDRQPVGMDMQFCAVAVEQKRASAWTVLFQTLVHRGIGQRIVQAF